MQTTPTRPKALVVDDHPIVTDALGTALVSLGVFREIDKESSVAAALERLRGDSQYGLILLDLHMSDSSGLDALHAIRSQVPDVRVVIFSGESGTATVIAAFEGGAHGFIPKNSPMPVVIGAIRMVVEGGLYIPREVIASIGVMSPPASPDGAQPAPGDRTTQLTARQRDVLTQVLQGVPNKVIATRLDMAEGTVKAHLSSIYRTFAVSNRARLIIAARSLNLL